jgi:hypothetical protein
MRRARLRRFNAFRFSAAALLCALASLACGSIGRAQRLPEPPYSNLAPYVDGTCTLPDKGTVDGWFAGGRVKKDGAVKPFMSTAFDPPDDCGFFAWAAQMFLWATSPVGTNRVFDSRGFFEVSPPDAQGQRGFRNPDGSPLDRRGKPEPLRLVPFATRGPAGTPVALDKRGNVIQHDEPVIDCGPPLRVRDLARNLVPVERTERVAEGRGLFFRRARDRKPIDTEVGQALCDDVLMAQNGSLVYYRVHVNAEYAFFLTGQKAGKIGLYRFPSYFGDVDDVAQFAGQFDSGHHYPELRYPEKCALTVEIKTSWIEAVPGLDLSKYITAEALVPTYRTGPRTWALRSRDRKVTLALVGMHIAGSAYDRHSMIWATFEHIGNAPNDGYNYDTAQNTSTPVLPPEPRAWLFWRDGGGDENVPRMHLDDKGNIVAYDGKTIGPTNTRRKKAWGSDPMAAQPNAELIAANQRVLGLLHEAGDVRGNYMMIGATWTDSGDLPTGPNETGTHQLANATLETFLQGNNCFVCHRGPKMPQSPEDGLLDGLSHIYGDATRGLKPLPAPSAAKSPETSSAHDMDCPSR